MLLELLRDLLYRLKPVIDLGSSELPRSAIQQVRQELEQVGETVERFLSGLLTHGGEHPEPLFAILRHLNPILVQKDQVLVTRFKDVQEVLARDDVFDVTYADKMRLITDGQNFFLGLPDSPRYAQDVSNMRIVVRRDDILSLVAPFVEEAAQSIVAAAPGVLEVVSGLTTLVPARLLAQYLGIAGSSERDFIAWATTLFWYLFLDPQEDPRVKSRAHMASFALNGAIDRSVAERKTTPSAVDDVLNRCLSLQSAATPGMSDLDIRNNFVGLIIGAIPTTATASALALDELLRRPEQLAGAMAAANAGDDALLAAFVFEALRFNPMLPGIYRRANRDFMLAEGEHRETLIPANATVLVATQSAMFDEHYLETRKNFDRSLPA